MKIKLQLSGSEKTLTLATIWSLVLTFSLLLFVGALIYKAAPSNIAIRIPTSKLADGARTIRVRALSPDTSYRVLFTGTTSAEVRDGVLTSIWQPPEKLSQKNFIIEVCANASGSSAENCFRQDQTSDVTAGNLGAVASASTETESLTSCPYYVSSMKTRKLASILGINSVDLESRVYCPQSVTGAEEFAPYSRADVIKATSQDGLGYLSGIVVANNGVLSSVSYEELVKRLDVKNPTQIITNQYLVDQAAGSSQTLQLSGQVLSISGGNSVTLPSTSYGLANSGSDGLLSAADWNTFAAKENSLSFGNGLVRSGDTVGLMSCAANEVIKSNGTSWLCAQDLVGAGSTTYNAGTGLALVGTTFNNTGVLDVSATGALVSSGGQNPAITLSTTSDLTQLAGQLGLSSTGVVPGTYNNVTVDSKGRVTAGTNISYLTTEQDGVIGNEVAGVVTGGGLVMTGSGTSGDPYRLGLVTTCAPGQVMKWNGGAWACANDIDTDTNTDQQALSFNPGTGDLSLTNGGTVNLSALNTDGQTLSVSGAGLLRQLSISSGNTVGLADSDNQALSLAANTLSLSSGGSVDLTPYLDNTDSQALSIAGNVISLTNGGSITLPADQNTTYSAGNGLSLTGTVFAINAPTCAGTTKLQWNGSAFVCATDVDTDTTYSAGTGLSLVGTTFTLTNDFGSSIDSTEITNGTIAAADLANSGASAGTYGDTGVNVPQLTVNAQGQVTSVSNRALPTASTSVTGILSSTDWNTFNGKENVLTFSDGLSRSTNTVTLMDCAASQILQRNAGDTAWVCANQVVDTNTTYSAGTGLSLVGTTFNNTGVLSVGASGALSSSGGQNPAITLSTTSDLTQLGSQLGLSTTGVGAGTYNNVTVDAQGRVTAGTNVSYLTAEGDGVVGNEIANVAVSGGLVMTGAGTSGDPYRVGMVTTCADNQLLKYTSGGGWACANDVDTDTNTDAQTLTWNSGTNALSISGGNTVDLTSLKDNTDSQAISRTGNTISITGSAGTVDLTPYLDNTDNQTLGLAGNTLSLTSGGTVDLSGYLDNTDSQTLSWNGGTRTLAIASGNSVVIPDSDTTYTNGNGLSLTATTFSINAPTCSGTTKLQWNGSAFLCSADVDTDTDTTNFNIRANAGASTNIAAGNTISFVDGTGTTASRSTNDVSFSLTNVGTAGTYGSSTTVPVITTDAQGRVTGVTNTAISFPAEVDGVIGNEVTNATTNGGLVRSGSGTGGSPYTLGLLTTCTDQQVLKYTLGTTSWGCANDSGGTSYTASNGITLTGSNFTLTNDFGSSIDSTEITNGTIAAADLANSGASAGTYGDTGVNVPQLTVNAQGQVTSVSNRALPTASTSVTGILSSTDWNTFNGKENVLTFTGNGLFSRSGDTITALAGTVGGQVIKWNGSAWVAGTDTDTTYTNGNGLSLSTGTFSINSPTCSGTTKLQWNGTAFVCSADVDTDTDTTNFNIRANAAASANIAAGNTVSFVDGTGTTASRSTNDISFSLTNVGTAGTYGSATTVPVITTDAQGRVTGVTNTAINFPAEVDGVIGNEVVSATANGGLTRSGSGTGGSPYTLGLLTTCGDQQVLKYTLGTTTWGCANDVDTNTTYTNGTGLSLVGTTFSITNTTVSASSYAPANNANGSLALPQFTVNAQGQLTAASTTNITLTGIANSQLANNSLTVTAGNGLLNGGSVALGGTTTLNIGAGNGITVNADDITIDLTAATDALSATTSSSSGLEVLASGLTLLQGCANSDVLKWNETTDVWACSTDNAGGVSDADKGDITVASSGTVWTIDPDTVALGTDTTGNYVADVAAGSGLTASGTAGEGWTPTLNIGAGTGITVNADDIALNCAATGASGVAFCQGGNSFGQAAFVGTNDGFALNLETGGTTRFTVDATASTLTGNGVTTINSGAASALNLDSGTTGAINIGTGANAKTITFGNATGATGLVLTSGSSGIAGSTTASITDGITFTANSVTSANGLKLSTTGLTTGNALQIVGPTESGLSTNNMLRVKNEDTFGFNKAQVIVGSGDTNNPEGIARDQLYVFGRINSSWNSFAQDFLSFQSNVAADGNFQNGFYDESAGTAGTAPSGQIQMQNVVGASGIARLTFTGTLGTGPWASNWGTGGNLVTERSLNPVFEARVQASANTDVRHVVGFTDLALGGTVNADTNNSANEAFFRKTAAGTNWEAVTRNASGTENVTTLATACSGGTACTTSAMRRLRIEVTNTGANGTVYFFVDGTLVATHNTTAVPASATRLGWLLAVTPTTATYTGRVLGMDYVRVWSDDPPESAPETALASSIADEVMAGMSDAVAAAPSVDDADTTQQVSALSEALPGVVVEGTNDIDQLKLATSLLAKLTGQEERLQKTEDALVALQASVDELRAAVWSGGIVSDDTTFKGLVTFSQPVSFSENNVGTVVVPAGQTSVQVTLPASLASTPKITASKQSFITGDWRITTVTRNGFVLELQQAQTDEVTFDWHAFANQ